MVEFNYERVSPEAVRGVHRLLQMMKRERTEGLSPSEARVLDRLEEVAEKMNGMQMLELILNNAPVFSRTLVK